MNKKQFKVMLEMIKDYDKNPYVFEEALSNKAGFDALYAEKRALMDLPEDSIPDLRIYRHISRDSKVQDVSIHEVTGIEDGAPIYTHGGFKHRVDYMCSDNNDLVAYKTFTDIYENGVFSKVRVDFYWINEDGTAGLTKVKFKRLSGTKRDSILVKRRTRVISYLKSVADGTPFEPYIQALFVKYKTQIDLYRDNGSDSFRQDMIAETDVNIRAILDSVFDPNTGATVMQSIIFNLEPMPQT